MPYVHNLKINTIYNKCWQSPIGCFAWQCVELIGLRGELSNLTYKLIYIFYFNKFWKYLEK